MFLAKRDMPVLPFAGLRNLDRLFDDLQREFFSEHWPLERPMPAMNLWDDGQNLCAEAEVPGFKMDELEVTVLGNELTIKGQHKSQQDNGRTYYRHERRTTEFTRVITLPVEVDAEKVEATLENGVLRIVMPKVKAAQVRKIEVKPA